MQCFVANLTRRLDTTNSLIQLEANVPFLISRVTSKIDSRTFVLYLLLEIIYALHTIMMSSQEIMSACKETTFIMPRG